MACNCGGSKLDNTKWLWTDTSGVVRTFTSEAEARMSAVRHGGFVKQEK
jgi:hypothetical protein